MEEAGAAMSSDVPTSSGRSPRRNEKNATVSVDSRTLIGGKSGQKPGERPVGTTTRRRRFSFVPWVLLAPTALFVLALTILPLAYAVLTSLRSFRFGQPLGFIGLQNYFGLFRDPHFYSSLGTTLTFTIAATTFEFVLGMMLALLLKEEFPWQGLIRSCLMIPMIISACGRRHCVETALQFGCRTSELRTPMVDRPSDQRSFQPLFGLAGNYSG